MGSTYLGVDLGGTKIYVMAISAEGKVLGRAKKKTKAETGFGGVIKRVVSCCGEALDQAKLSWKNVAAVGAGVPSSIDPKSGLLINAVNLGWKNAPLQDALEKIISKPVFLDNDVNLGLYGEYRRGVARGLRDVVGFFVGTGIGGGLIINGKIHRGFNGMAAELGHQILVRRGALCGCGNEGCLESFSSRLAITRDIRRRIEAGEPTILKKLIEKDNGDLRSAALKEGWDQKDPLTRDVLEEACLWLGMSVANLITIICPEMVVLGGGVMEALGKDLLPRVERQARRMVFPGSDKGIRIALAALGDDSVAIGAAEYAKDRLELGKGKKH